MNGASIRVDNPPQQAVETTIYAPAALEAARKKRMAQIPLRQRVVFRQAWRGNCRKAAIRAMCLECMGYQAAEVDRCTAPACPLYPYREDRL